MDFLKIFYQKYGQSILGVLILILVIVDVLYLTIWRDTFVSPMVSFVSGTLICVFALLVFDNRKVEDFTLKKHKINIIRVLCLLVPMIIGVYITSDMLSEIIVKYPSDHKYSDILPALHEIYIKRFLNGENVYAVYEKFGNPLYPNYLPFQWMPYLAAHGIGIDFRWLAYGIFIFALLIWNIRLLRKPIYGLELFIKSALPFGIMYLLIIHRKMSFATSVELTIVGFYLIFAYTLFKKSNITRSIGILLPLLSRFSFLFWLVFYAIATFITDRKNALQIAKWTTLGVVLIYILPFFLREPNAFFDGVNYYNKASYFEWHTRHWQKEGAYPYHLNNGVSFSVYFYEYVDGEVEDKLGTAQLFHKIMGLASALLMGLFFWWRKGKSDLRLVSLVGLKFCIGWFYAFLYLPFFYLYFLPIFLSMIILYECNIFQYQKTD